MSPAADAAGIWGRVAAVLAAEEFRAHASGFDRLPLIRMTNALGGPTMRLLHWRKLEELGRIPHSGEGHAVDAVAGVEAFGAPLVEIFMVSHRWLRPSRDRSVAHPDGAGHEKARAIHEFSLWRRQWVRHQHGFLPEIYYWIDYCCIDQTNTEPAVPLLPLWVACCERFLRIETPDYHERAWCRVEPLLARVFSFADHQVSIGPDYRCRWPDTGTEAAAPLLDPRAGLVTNPEDLRLINPLAELAAAARPAADRDAVQLGSTAVRCFRL